MKNWWWILVVVAALGFIVYLVLSTQTPQNSHEYTFSKGTSLERGS